MPPAAKAYPAVEKERNTSMTTTVSRRSAQVPLDSPPAAGLEVLERGDLQRVRDEIDLELRPVHRVHGEADALDGDRALAGDVFREFRRRAPHAAMALPRRLERGHLA